MPVYKNEERNTWYTSFYYTDWTGQRKRKKKEGFALKRDAQEYEREFLLKYSGSCDMPFRVMVEIYLTDCKAKDKPTSLEVKENALNKHILPYFKDLQLNKITAAHVRHWQQALLEQGKYSSNYLNHLGGYLSAVFNFAIKYYGLPTNPVKDCGKIKAKRTELNFWTLEQFEIFLRTLDEKHYTERLSFLFLFWCGMRLGELQALTLNDFDFEKHTITINKSYVRFKQQDLIQTPKTESSNRIITIPAFLEEAVKEYLEKLYAYDPADRLFPASIHVLRKLLVSGSEAADLPRIRIHDLRHSHASLLIHQGISPLMIKERLGHENIEITLNTYSHLYPNKQEELAGMLQEIFENGTFLVR